METDELKNIWNTLANNNLIDKDIAKENIEKIISKKSAGLLYKMSKKIEGEKIFYFVLILIIPLVIYGVNYLVHNSYPPVLQIIGVASIEGYFIFMYLKAKTKLKYINSSSSSESIKDNLISFKKKYTNDLQKEGRAVFVFGYVLLILAAIQFFIYKGSVLPIDFSNTANYIIIFIVLMMILLPSIIKMEGKIRNSKFIKGIEDTINELEEEK